MEDDVKKNKHKHSWRCWSSFAHASTRY